MLKSRLILSVVASLTLVSFAKASDQPTLEERLENLAEELESARQEAHVPGMSIAIVRNDEIIWARGFGLADVEAERPADKNTIYGVGSTTKAFTATLVGMLADQGKASWDDPVTKHLPYFDLAVRSDDESAECTLRDLLSHRHGFTRMGVLTLGNASREEVLRAASGAEPFDDFREGFHYCNVTYLAAGQAAGAAADSTWEELMRERIFEPLRMNSSTLTAPAARHDDRLARGYNWQESTSENEPQEMMDLGVIGPAGSINSNVLDMAQWIRLQLGTGQVDGNRLISMENLRETWKPQIDITKEVSYGLGWMLHEHKGRAVVEHGGNVAGFTAEVAFMPEENLGYVLLMNLGVSPLREPSIGIVFDALLDDHTEQAEVKSVAVEDLEQYAGFYLANFDSFRDERFEVQVSDDSLSLNIPSQQLFQMKLPTAEGLWGFEITDQINVSFQRDEAGQITGLTIHQGPFAFDAPREGIEVTPEAPLEELLKYAGTYDVGNTGRQCKVIVKHGRLFFDSGKELMPLIAPDEDGHAPMRGRADFGATFMKDAEGNVESFILHGSKDRTMTRALESDEADLPTLEEVLALRDVDKRAASMQAAGGIKATGTVWAAQAGARGTLTIFSQGTDRYANHLDFGKFGRVDTVAKGGEAWSYNPLLGHKTLKGEELMQAILQHPGAVEGDWNEYFDSVEVVRNDHVSERPVHVVRLKKKGLRSRTYSVDAENGDVLQVKMIAVDNTVRIPVTITYSDFKIANGIRTPMEIEIANPFSGRTVLTIKKLESGLELSDEVFELKDLDSE